ncbi:tyrosine-type recombinase/integrase [Sulfobacillus harzensis]|uniref:Tyrosine-type recombinase/integrase n=1 Tax=Sulfobacillus harzensis TaxID=2729629 RepID=A0A7Y0LA79_9FIRM|nr:tyrosine-type recombinase/integrase [Sulfobacillus harzensis]NMP24714.1 tyrosine-type recombinase/integrase [Sulfobacillus harzensis]
MHISQASQQYLATRKQEGYSPYTLAAYRLQHHLLMRVLGDIELELVTLEDVRAYLAQAAHLRPSSLGHRVRAINSLFRWCEDEGILIPNPIRKLKEPKLGQRVPKALNLDELEMLRDACKTTLEHAVVEFFFATGCRVGEAVRLNRNDVDWQRGCVIVVGKGNKEREVYFGSKSRIWLVRYIHGRQDTDAALFVTQRAPRRMTIRGIQGVFKRVARRCGLEHKVHPHTMRHTLATTLLNQGAPLAAVQSILGHEKPETTQLYAVLSGESRHQMYQRYFVQ